MKTRMISRTKICNQNIKAYKRLQLLGHGTFGFVYKAQHLQNKNIVAIKKLKKRNNPQDGISSSFLREISLLRRLSHPNIIKSLIINARLLDVSATENNEFAYIVMEYLPIDLQKQISSQYEESQTGFPMDIAKTIVRELLKGISYCHSNSIFHRDIKPANILMNKSKTTIKIADFGIAKQLLNNPQPHTEVVSSLFYRAPQILMESKHYGRQIDIWAVGCIMAECITGKILFQSPDATQLCQILVILRSLGVQSKQDYSLTYDNLQTMRSSFYQIPQICISESFSELAILGESGLDLLNKMLQINPKQRISAQEALNHPFLTSHIPQEIQFKQIENMELAQNN